jgi:hypothetical protein
MVFASLPKKLYATVNLYLTFYVNARKIDDPWVLPYLVSSGITLSPSFSTVPANLRLTVLQNHLINNLSTQNASPSQKMLIGTIESFIDHYTTTTMTLHTTLLKLDYLLLRKN